MTSRQTNILIICFFTLITVLAYFPSFSSDFLFDDHPLIEKNTVIENLKNVPLFFTSKEARIPWTHGGLQDDTYRPLQSTSYALSAHIWGKTPMYFHIENVLLHLINGILIYFLLNHILRRRGLSFLSGLFFLIHPVQVEAVTYLSERASLLSLFFFLLSFLFFLNSDIRKGKFDFKLLISLFFFSAGLLSKETAIILPAIIVLYMICFSEREEATFPKIFSSCWYYFLVAVVYLVVRTLNLGQFAQQVSVGKGDLFLIMAGVFCRYLRLFIYPANLTFFPEVNAKGLVLSDIYIIYFAVIIGFTFLTIYMFKKNKKVSFFLLGYLIALLPVSNIIPIKAYMQERFLYFPSVFIFTFLAYVFILVWQGLSKIKPLLARIILLPVYSTIIGVLVFSTYSRNLEWKDEITLVEREIELHPDNGRLYFDLGHIYFQKKEYEKSQEYLEKALSANLSNTNRALVYDRLGNIGYETRNFNKAIGYYLKAIEWAPDYPYPYNSIGHIYSQMGQLGKAKPYFEKAVEIRPDYPMYLRNLGFSYFALGNKREALKFLKRSLEMNPNQPRVKQFISQNF